MYKIIEDKLKELNELKISCGTPQASIEFMRGDEFLTIILYRRPNEPLKRLISLEGKDTQYIDALVIVAGLELLEEEKENTQRAAQNPVKKQYETNFLATELILSIIKANKRNIKINLTEFVADYVKDIDITEDNVFITSEDLMKYITINIFNYGYMIVEDEVEQIKIC